jgi:hypothetical protein
MMRKVGSIHFEDEKLKNVLVCELIYRVVMATTRPLPKTKSKYIYIWLPSIITQNGAK